MNRKYCLDKKEWEEAQAALLLAKQFGLIEDAGIEALEKRRAKKNKENSLYGVRFYSPAMYLQYELTRFKLDFVQPSEQIKKLGVCPGFTEEEKRAFYENNQDLFGRYHGDLFDYEDVRQIIEKRLREDAYDRLIPVSSTHLCLFFFTLLFALPKWIFFFPNFLFVSII